MKRKRLTLLIACLLLISAIRMADGSPKRVLTTLGIYFGDHIAYSPDGRLLALADSNLLFLLDAETLTQVGTFMQYGARNSINAMDFSPDGRWLAAGNGDGIITIWDVHKMTEKFTIQAYERRAGDLEPRGEVVDIAFHPDSKTLASVGDYGIIKFWNVATGKEIRSFKDVGNTIAFHPIGKFLASGSGVWPGEHGPETVQIWDLDSEQVLFALPTQEYIFEVAFTPNPDERVVAFSTNRKTKLWKNWQLQNQVITLETEGNTRHPVFTPDGRTLITAGDAIRFWDVETGNLIRIFPNSESRTIALHPDGNRLATVSSLDHHLQILDTAKGELINELDVSNVINFTIVFSALMDVSSRRCLTKFTSGMQLLVNNYKLLTIAGYY